MIESIHVANIATYGNTPEIMDGLSQFNDIFGSNGTGKTTISRIINNEDLFPSCTVNWQGRTKLETLVYNEDFVKRNFDQVPELKGVFTLGEESKETLKKIDETAKERDRLIEEIEQLSCSLSSEDGIDSILFEFEFLRYLKRNSVVVERLQSSTAAGE
jgi:ATPase subunit of ABC transporter with duplicated ATPase domains